MTVAQMDIIRQLVLQLRRLINVFSVLLESMAQEVYLVQTVQQENIHMILVEHNAVYVVFQKLE